MGKKPMKNNSNTDTIESSDIERSVKSYKVQEKKVKIKCKNKKQKEFINMIDNYEITLCDGPAGCGKSFLSIAKALEYLQIPDNGYDKLYIITPAVEIEEKLGALPGDLNSKLDPFLFSSYYLIDKLIGKDNRTKMINEGIIQPLALAFLRGVNIDNAILIFEEAQNSSLKQMKTLLTRIGENSKFIISGDINQIDRFKTSAESGLIDAMERFKEFDKIGKCHFSDGDSVRNEIINDILTCY